MIEFKKQTNMRLNSFLMIVFSSQAVASLSILKFVQFDVWNIVWHGIHEFKKYSDAHDRFMTLVLMFEVMVG